MGNYVNSSEKVHCTGCGLCSAICPCNAINMVRSEKDGFIYPVIEEEKCISCGKCIQCCPVGDAAKGQKQVRYYFPDVYAVQASNDIRMKSSSGGIFSIFGLKILEQGGAIAGVAWNKNMEAFHLLVSDKNDFFRIQGSKYTQSRMDNIYQDMEKALRDGRRVLFCGTPCQTAAVRNYFNTAGMDEGLFLVDLLCRGVPSYKAFRCYIDEEAKKENSKAIYVRMKEKEHGWSNIGQLIFFSNGHQNYYGHYDCLYIDSFLRDNISVRSSCFSCPYKDMDRNSDITIGDFWGYRNPNFQDELGTSVVMIHSQKGKELFESVKDDLKLIPTTSWRVIKGNYFAFHQLPLNQARDEFFSLLNLHPFSEALAIARDHKRIAEQNFKNLPECLDVVTVGTTQGMYAFDYTAIPLSGFNMARYKNLLMCNMEMLQYNKEKIRKGAVILITLEYPIFLCRNSHDSNLQSERIIREKNYHYMKEMNGLNVLGLRNYRMNHMKSWEIEREIHNLMKSWEHEMGLQGIIHAEEYVAEAREKLEIAIEDCENLIDYCREKGWNPILIGLPYSRNLNDCVPKTFKNRYFYNPIKEIIKHSGVRFIDYSSDDRFSSIHLYMNTWFLNERGRKEFTKLVYEEVIKEIVHGNQQGVHY